MDIALLVLAWLLIGCAVAWIMGAAISLGDVSAERTSGQDAFKRTGNSLTTEFAAGSENPDTILELSAAAGNERRRSRTK